MKFSGTQSPERVCPIERFADGKTFVTRSGGYGRMFGVRGIDPECLTPGHLSAISDRIAMALRLLPEGSILYQYALRRTGLRIPETRHPNSRVQQQIHNRLEHLHQHGRIGENWLAWTLYVPAESSLTSWADRNRLRTSLREIHRAGIVLEKDQSDVVHLEPWDQDQIVRFYSYLMNLDLRMITPRLQSRKRPVNQQLSNHCVTWDADHDYLRIGKRWIQPINLLSEPVGTKPALWSDLLTLDAEVVFCSIWSGQTVEQIKHQVHLQEGYLSFFKYKLGQVMAHSKGEPVEKTAEGAANEEDAALDLKGIIKDMNRGKRYGKWAFTGFVHSRDPKQIENALPDIGKVFRQPSEARIIEEEVGAMSAYYSLFPGNQSYAIRDFYMSDRHVANLSNVYVPYTGSPKSESLGEYLGLFGTPRGTPFYFDPYNQDGLRGLLIIGPPRTGKSVTGNYLVDSEQKLNGYTYIFDIGGSYEHTVLYHNGTVTRIGLGQSLGNPFHLPPTEGNIQFLFRWLRGMLVNAGVPMGPDEEAVLGNKIRQIYRLDPEVRRLKYLAPLLSASGNDLMERGLAKWIEGGIYGRVFDNLDPIIGIDRIQVFEFAEVGEKKEFSDLMEPTLSWLGMLVSGVIEDPANLGRPKHLVYEELWRHIKDQQMWNRLLGDLKTGGKRLSGVTLLTHLVDDLGEYAETIKNACPMQMFLRHPEGFPREKYATFFGLNERQLDVICGLKQKQVFLNAGSFSIVLELDLDPQAYYRYSTKPADILERAAAIEAHGREKAFEVLTA